MFDMFNIGKIIGIPFKRKKYDVYFFIPHMQTGGAEIVHLYTLEFLKKKGCKVKVVVTNSHEKDLKEYFVNLASVTDIHYIKYNRKLFQLVLGFYVSLLNKLENKIFIGSHSYFFYRLIPFLHNKNLTVDVIHNLLYGESIRYEKVFDKICDKINKIVCVDCKTSERLREVTQRSDIRVVNNPTDEVFFQNHKIRHSVNKRCVFVGRDHPDKRIGIIEEIAEDDNIVIGMVGDFSNRETIESIKYHGLLTNRPELANVMNEYDILVITSKTEAFPMVIQEAMALGMIVLATRVGGIDCHIKDGVNGLLVEDGTPEEVANRIKHQINQLSSDRNLAGKISRNAYDYAANHFSVEKFNQSMSEILTA